MKNCIRKCAYFSNEAYKNGIESLQESILIENKRVDTQVHIGKDNDNLYIIFRGTSSLKDVLSDVKIWRKKCIYLNNTLLHSGFLEQYEAVRTDILNKIKTFQKVNIKRIIFSGHSLGAALATIASVDFKIQHKDIEVCCATFASPRVGDRAFAKLFNKTVNFSYRIVYHRDPITFLPTLIRFKHVKGCIHFKKNGKVHISDQYFFPVGCLISQHFMENYKNTVDNWLNSSEITLEV